MNRSEALVKHSSLTPRRTDNKAVKQLDQHNTPTSIAKRNNATLTMIRKCSARTPQFTERTQHRERISRQAHITLYLTIVRGR